jgi:hypothetical protein
MNRDLERRLRKLEAAYEEKLNRDREFRVVWKKAIKMPSGPDPPEVRPTSDPIAGESPLTSPGDQNKEPT